MNLKTITKHRQTQSVLLVSSTLNMVYFLNMEEQILLDKMELHLLQTTDNLQPPYMA
jgi:hypothetical protein